MSTIERTVGYLFILALVLVFVAYYAGSNRLLSTTFAGVNQLGLTFTGRNAQGNFAAYPVGG